MVNPNKFLIFVPVTITNFKNKIMIIHEWDISRELYFVRDLDTDRNMFIGTMDECKKFQIDYNKEQEKYYC